MILLVVLSGIGVLLLGYILMDHLDRSIGNGAIVPNEQATRKGRVAAIVMTQNSNIVNRISQVLNEKGISFMMVEDEYIPHNVDFQYVMAFSDNDLKNLLFCEAAKHENPKVIMIAQCHDTLYQKMYHDVGIHKLLTGKISDHDLAVFLKGEDWKFTEEG